MRYQKSVISTGCQEGKEDGYKEGREEGIEKGKEVGREEANHSTALKMLGLGLDYETISQVTGLTPREIEPIKVP